MLFYQLLLDWTTSTMTTDTVNLIQQHFQYRWIRSTVSVDMVSAEHGERAPHMVIFVASCVKDIVMVCQKIMQILKQIF